MRRISLRLTFKTQMQQAISENLTAANHTSPMPFDATFDLSASKKRWAIIGGGMLGMTLALRLAQAGEDVTLFEGGETLGGLAATWNLGGIVWDKHYHVTLLSDTFTRALLAELGLENETRWVETRTGFYTDGRLYSMSNTLEFLRFPPLNLIDKLRLGGTIFYAARIKNWRRLEQVHVGSWLRRWSGARTYERIWLPLLRAKLGENYKDVSAAFIWATIARMYAARRTGLKREMFGYVAGGYKSILEKFERKIEEAGVDVRCHHKLKRISKDAGAENHTTRKLNVEFENGACETFDEVVLTIPSKVAAHACAELDSDERDKLLAITYQGIICASVLLKKPLAGFYVTNITDAGVPFTAVIEMSALVDCAEFGGNALVYLPKYVTCDDASFALSDEELKEKFLSALASMYPDFESSDVLAFQVSRVRNVFPLPTINYSARLPEVTTSIPNLHIVNSTRITNGTLNVNETIQLAENAARDFIQSSQAVNKKEKSSA